MAAKVFVKSGDTVQVISGDDKGVKGKVQKVFPETGRVIVEKVNMVKKHQKPRGQGMPGGIIEQEAAIDASNVMVVCPKCGKPSRMGHKYLDGEGKASRRKVRVCKECGATIDN
ncbi:MAG: 50S ribosomal protein L24 [Clostridiales bacterium]|nr:50S ribosomal protein L24 [Clostridiales bacterium]